jgi:hypothetical protein
MELNVVIERGEALCGKGLAKHHHLVCREGLTCGRPLQLLAQLFLGVLKAATAILRQSLIGLFGKWKLLEVATVVT